MRDVAIVGGGPAGMCLGIALALKGVDAVVLERGGPPWDKACGEGLMPKGLRVLEALGVRQKLDPDGCASFRGIRYVQEDGTFAEAAVPGGGLGVRRTALMAALHARAAEVGLEVRHGTGVRGHAQAADRVRVTTDGETVETKVLVACDGLGSVIRKAEGLDMPARGPARYGLRQHFRMPAWTDAVEIHFGAGAEAYVTPVGPERIGVAFLFTRSHDQPVNIHHLVSRFPALQSRLTGATPDSEPRGSGPFLRRVKQPVKGRVVLLGDAAGYVDAITGEGMSLAFESASMLAEATPEALRSESPEAALRPWVQSRSRAFRHYALWAHALLGIARRPSLRRQVIAQMARSPSLFEWTVRQAVGAP